MLAELILGNMKTKTFREKNTEQMTIKLNKFFANKLIKIISVKFSPVISVEGDTYKAVVVYKLK